MLLTSDGVLFDVLRPFLSTKSESGHFSDSSTVLSVVNVIHAQAVLVEWPRVASSGLMR